MVEQEPEAMRDGKWPGTDGSESRAILIADGLGWGKGGGGKERKEG